MNISFDEGTKNALIKALEDSNKSAVRIILRGFSWAGPYFAVVLDEQLETDEVLVVDDIKFVAKKDITRLLQNAQIRYKKGLFRNSFNIELLSASGSCRL